MDEEDKRGRVRQMKIRNYMKPSSLEEAYELVASGGTILGGGAWLKLMPKTIETAVDIGGLGLDVIKETEEHIVIGSMTTLRTIETSQVLGQYMGGVVCDAASHIMGVTVRNIATVGGSVANRFGFSDLLPTLLALDVTLRFQHHGTISLESFLATSLSEKDILVEIILKKDQGVGAYRSIKKTSTDFPVLNASVTRIGHHYRIAVGARPGAARLASQAMSVLNEASSVKEEDIQAAAALVATELSYGSNSRGSKAYRAQVSKVLVERCIREVLV